MNECICEDCLYNAYYSGIYHHVCCNNEDRATELNLKECKDKEEVSL